MSLVDVSKDTLSTLLKGEYNVNGKVIDLKKDIVESVNKTKTLGINPLAAWTNKFNPNYYFLNLTTTGCVEFLNDKGFNDICILNFASGIKPGGGWLNGRIAQEEDIMRKTTGYLSIASQKDFYTKNICCGDYYEHDLIYSPNVLVIKDKDFNYIEPIKISMITCPAVNAAKIQRRAEYTTHKEDFDNYIYNKMYDRIVNIIECAITFNNKNIVLGAYGCGVFKNDAEKISEIFKKVLKDLKYEEYFENIIFGIYEQNPYLLPIFEKTLS